MQHSHSLSKSKYLLGLQCPKSLWLLKGGKIKPKAPDEFLQAIFDEGTKVGEEAQKLFPDGKLIEFEGSTFDEKCEFGKTVVLLEQSNTFLGAKGRRTGNKKRERERETETKKHAPPPSKTN